MARANDHARCRNPVDSNSFDWTIKGIGAAEDGRSPSALNHQPTALRAAGSNHVFNRASAGYSEGSIRLTNGAIGANEGFRAKDTVLVADKGSAIVYSQGSISKLRCGASPHNTLMQIETK